ncbi:MAG: molybdopterin-dependent oxidoreductase [Coriobacteriia bacterium]|nr:molybdopterin-dependent oxidoreductase [Coriobacteriia bacterium]
MTNNWTDLGNASCFVVMGANPAENHPASMAHMNKARAKGAKLIVIDPRKTRTAMLADLYVRIRPGTDIAFVNSVIHYITDWMEANPADAKSVKFFQYLNQTYTGTFFNDGTAITASTRTANYADSSKYTDARFYVNAAGTDYVRTDNGKTAQWPDRASDCRVNKSSTELTVYNALKAHVANYTPAVIAGVCGCSQAEIEAVAMAFINNSRCASPGDVSIGVAAATDGNPTVTGFKALTMLYAMGLTQHTYGSQGVKSFAVIQSLMGNMGRAGGGINALRGIHNVQGSTDQGLLYGNIPAYSGNPGPSNGPNAFGKYMDALWGYPLSGSGKRAQMDSTYEDAFDTGLFTGGSNAWNDRVMWWQQRGFYNMTQQWFGDTTCTGRTKVEAIYDLWPKGNGDNHIQMFRAMAAGVTTAAVVWGQNPAVTEPNQKMVRAGLKKLKLLVVTDMFATETVECERDANTVTYVLPACSHVEEAGSVTNSGRVLQWRQQAVKPLGNSKADMELLLRFAKALSVGGAFNHIKAVIGTGGLALTDGDDVFKKLYGDPYTGVGAWVKNGGTATFDELTFSSTGAPAERTWAKGSYGAPSGGFWAGAALPASGFAAIPDGGTIHDSGVTLTGSEAVTERIYRTMTSPQHDATNPGTIWIYTDAFVAGNNYDGNRAHTNQGSWALQNRAKCRDTRDPNGTLAYPGWGYAWLVNRRVLYNNGEIPGDTADNFMRPDQCTTMFTGKSNVVFKYSRFYRANHLLQDKPDVTGNHSIYAGRFPAHTEPYETSREDLLPAWGRNTNDTDGTGRTGNLLIAGTERGTVADYPLVLTTIRCVEHFQGGPTTRNNSWNVEAEPVPWIEINSVDARTYGIGDGDMVNIITARSNSTTEQEARTHETTGWAKGFKARVGVGLKSNQRVAQGVVAIPWHWGDQGLSKGSRANDLCIDAMDANTTIPEYKACLCKIVKL